MKKYLFAVLALLFTAGAQAESLPRYELSADNIASWQVNGESITVHLTDNARDAFHLLTQENLNKKLEVYIDGKLVFAPVVRTSIPSGTLAFDSRPDVLDALNACCAATRKPE